MAINQNWMALVLNPKAHTHTPLTSSFWTSTLWTRQFLHKICVLKELQNRQYGIIRYTVVYMFFLTKLQRYQRLIQIVCLLSFWAIPHVCLATNPNPIDTPLIESSNPKFGVLACFSHTHTNNISWCPPVVMWTLVYQPPGQCDLYQTTSTSSSTRVLSTNKP